MSEGFAAIPNWMYRDSELSSYAIMTYGALASHSGKGGIYPSQVTLAVEARCSVRKLRDALVELEKLGVIERVRRSSRAGRSADGYLLRPNGFELDQQPAHDAGSEEQPAPGAAATGTSVHSVPSIEEEPIKKSASECFDDFWAVYPRHTAKAAARTKFLTLAKKQDPQVIVDGARRYSADPNLPEKQFIPYPTTWLNQGRWEDEPLPPRADRPAPAAPAAVSRVDEDAARDAWLAAHGITLAEYQDHWDEPGWLDALEAKVSELV